MKRLATLALATSLALVPFSAQANRESDIAIGIIGGIIGGIILNEQLKDAREYRPYPPPDYYRAYPRQGQCYTERYRYWDGYNNRWLFDYRQVCY